MVLTMDVDLSLGIKLTRGINFLKVLVSSFLLFGSSRINCKSVTKLQFCGPGFIQLINCVSFLFWPTLIIPGKQVGLCRPIVLGVTYGQNSSWG